MSTSSTENVQFTNPTFDAFNEVINLLASELKINNEKITSLKSRVSEILKTVSTAKAEKKPSTRKTKKDSPDAKQCQYEFGKRSKNPGEKCGGKVCEESKSGLYCKKHLKQENVEEKSSKPSEKKEKKEKKEKASAKTANSKNESKESTPPAVQTLQDSAPVCTVKKNQWGNYAHEGTGFIFDRKTHNVFGRQKSDGTVAQLTAEDIESCKSLGFSYTLPPNLTSAEDKQAEEEDVEPEESEEEDDEDGDE